MGIRSRPSARVHVFGSLPHVPRPIVLILVYGVFLVIVGITATAQSIIVTTQLSVSALNTSIGADASLVRSYVNLSLAPSDLQSPVGPARLGEVTAQIRALISRGELLHVEILTPTGTVLFSEDPSIVGRVAGQTADFKTALLGGVSPAIVRSGAPTESLVGLDAPDLIREYLPMSSSGQVVAVVAFWRDAGPVLAQIDQIRTSVVIVTLGAALVVAAVLFVVFRSAQRRISRQTIDLVEATRRDPLTGLLNHGSVVAHLAGLVDEARRSGNSIGVALVDIDGFRLLNENYGHEAGDLALQEVAALVGKVPNAVTARSGPDEFLLLLSGEAVADLESAMDRLRAGLVERSLEFDESERLPLTVSIGISIFPVDGDSATALLSAAGVALAEATASGGDSVVLARPSTSVDHEARAFDTLQGLVLAVDAKDRYTKRHSEDVARYATFLGRQLGLDAEMIRALETAGRLHDLGKIGIPDRILRKPARLTDEEYEVVKQHVALGDLIIRDLPNLELVRAGVRHHHERWDGTGYLAGLAGPEIPLIARILAVGDAFSAMTSTRPYRKALTVSEALTRLGDAAGSQLDEALVRAFIGGIESATDPPLPGGIFVPFDRPRPRAIARVA